MKYVRFFSWIFLCVGWLTACMGEEEELSLSPYEVLAFSNDSLHFDTIITGQTTQTHTFRLYNRHNKTLRIAHLRWEQGEKTLFRLNVDGVSVPAQGLKDIDLAPKDSLQVFVDMTAPRTGQQQAQLLQEELLLQLHNGVQQKLHFSAYAQDFENLNARVVTTDSTLRGTLPYQILDSLVVAKGAVLRLMPGTCLYFEAGAKLIVHGRLLAEGTQQQPIVLRGNRLGKMFSNQAYDSMPSQWGGVQFTSSSTGNVMRYCDLHSADFGIRCAPSNTEIRKLLLENSVIHNFSQDAFYAEQCYTEVGNTQLSNAGGNCVQLVGGKHYFTHCTIAQFYVFSAQRGAALHYRNEQQGLRAPLEKAEFNNCIITGYGVDDVDAQPSARYTDEAFHFSFQNCLLNTPNPKDHRVNECIFEEELTPSERREKHFSPDFDLQKLLFRFELAEKTVARGKASTSITQNSYPTDPRGKQRLQNGTADLGCYEAE